MVERIIGNDEVGSSILPRGTIFLGFLTVSALILATLLILAALSDRVDAGGHLT